MLDEIFRIDTFNVYSDDDNYYFFRALNMADNNDMESGITSDENGIVQRIRTNLERYEDTPIYSPNDAISLEQVFDHIKMHQRKDTNCISLTSNANTAITYGRQNYKDKYIMVKTPKTDIGKRVYEAGLYMLEEANNRINILVKNNDLSEEQISILNEIDNISSREELEQLKSRLHLANETNDTLYEYGLDRITNSINYVSLNDEQNFEKDKIVLKLDVLKSNLLKGASNKLLIQTIGNAFSSLELIHYGEITKHEFIELPKELIDILAIVQQLPNSLSNIEDLKKHLLTRIQAIKISGTYNYDDLILDDDMFSLDNIYDLTNGKISYFDTCDLFRKSYYFAKSKIRMNNSLRLLKQILGDNDNYQEIYNHIEKNTFGVEPEITTRVSGNKIQVSESVSLDFMSSERKLFEYLTQLNIGQLNYIIKNPNEALKILLNIFIDEKMDVSLQSKEEWYANSIIDMLDLERLGVKSNLSNTQRNDLVYSLVNNDFYSRYQHLKEKGYNNKQISSLIFNYLIRNDESENLNNLFSLEELEYFLGYNRIKGTGLNLRSYQKLAVDNIDKTFVNKQFTSAILPTGAGKSFVALAEMYKHRDEKILYLAPNIEILNQVKGYIRKVYRPEEHIGDKESDPIKRMFPNVIFDTYQHLREESASDVINTKYSLIIFDELHRTGAKEWQKQVKELLDNQDDRVKVLGITATPERDVDLKDMTDYWAHYYGYSDEEILKGNHISINMDLFEAIRLGYVVNPKVLNCEYSLISSGDLDGLKLSIDDIKDDNIKGEVSRKYEFLRRNVEKSNGIEKILSDNLSSYGKYIVFLPVNKKDDGTYEDQDGNVIGRETAERIILSYKTLMKQYLFSEEYFEEKGEYILRINDKIISSVPLDVNDISFLNQEKENVLLLSQIDIKNKPSSLNTKNNMIIERIIKYCNWEKYSDRELTKRINVKMRDKVEDYSMLGSYSNKKNKANLDSFNNNTSSKIKFMFVMNKLNEGVHVNNINGIIWLRPLDFNSKILYLQQLGRCIYSINPNIDFKDNDRPLVLDLVNNTLKVKLEKGTSPEETDLNKLLLIKSWISINNRFPKYESSDKVEKEYALSLNIIHKRYNAYLIDESLINDKSAEKRLLIQSIIEEGFQLDLWSQKIMTYERSVIKNNVQNNNEIFAYLELSANIRDFLELENRINSVDVSRSDILKCVKRVQEYCETYHEWPNQSEESKNNKTKDGKTGMQLHGWLEYSGFRTGNFKYLDVTDENGKPIKDILDGLYVKYYHPTRFSDEAKLKQVKRIQEYCETYHEWPNYSKESNNNKTKDGKTSMQLYDWLSRSGFRTGNFKYLDVTDENGKPIKDILDGLYVKYYHPTMYSDESKLKWVKRVQEYCETYHEWPNRSKESNNNKTKDETTGMQLYDWLRNSGFQTGNFKYLDVTDENGKLIKGILDELYKNYGHQSMFSDEAKLEWVKRVQEYCETYHEWPNYNKESKKYKTKDGKASEQLYDWLRNSGFQTDNFKYLDVNDENGKQIKDILDGLYVKYGHPTMYSDEARLKWVKRVQEYCETYHEWPNYNKESKKYKTKDGKTSEQLYDWLRNSGFRTGNFKYLDVTDENGKPIKDILDELYVKYYHPTMYSDEAKLKWVKRVQEYCETYHEWPNRSKESNNNKTKDGKTGMQLYDWLNSSGFRTGSFKYLDVTDENGKPIKGILDELYKKYKLKRINEYNTAKKKFDEVSEFSKAINDGKDMDNETGIHRIG